MVIAGKANKQKEKRTIVPPRLIFVNFLVCLQPVFCIHSMYCFLKKIFIKV